MSKIAAVDGMRFGVDTDLELWRVQTMHTKEPETIAWIDSFDGGIFLDIGANIGIYTLYAAITHPDMTVIAVEPEIRNFCRLVSNIELNGLTNVIPLNVGMGSGADFTTFGSADERVGNSGGQLGKGKRPTMVFPVNDMPICPDYVKIDVDGLEKDIILGLSFVLDSGCVKSILVEVNQGRGWFDNYFSGYTTDNSFNSMTPHSRERRKGYPENVVYTRP